jgi:hypothetical protein
MNSDKTRLSIAAATVLAALVLVLASGCDRAAPRYVVGEVYSLTEPTLPAPTFRAVKVIEVRGTKLVLCFTGGFAPQRQVSVAQFPTNSPATYFNLSIRDFEKKSPVLLGTLPLSPQDTAHLSKPRFP